MPDFTQKKMCSECPFRKASLRGWLGPWKLEQIEQLIHSDGDFICHLDVNKRIEADQPMEEIYEEGQHCVGFLRYMNSVCKLSRRPEKMAAQREVEEYDDQPTIEAFGFRQHHGSHQQHGQSHGHEVDGSG